MQTILTMVLKSVSQPTLLTDDGPLCFLYGRVLLMEGRTVEEDQEQKKMRGKMEMH